MRKWLLYVIILFLGTPALLVAQLDNRAFTFKDSISSPRQNNLYFTLHSLGFNKNNEYFNRIADGYTLFGMQVSPGIGYYLTDNISLYGGLYARQDFGNDGFYQVEPEFRMTIRQHNLSIIFGSLIGNLSHQMAEPMYGFERVIENSLEYGLQFIYNKPLLKSDLWIHWEDMLYRGEAEQERLSVGLSSRIFALNRSSWELSFPVQLLAHHKGGQIDASPLPLTTILNGAYGVTVEWASKSQAFVRGFRMDHLFLHYNDLSRERQTVYKNGYGIYLNATLNTAVTDLMVAYWYGNRYYNPYGNAIYNSVSTTYKHPGHTEETRPLLIIRFMKDIEILDNLYLISRFEPHYDFNNARIDFSHGIYISYKSHFMLKNGVGRDH